MNLVIDTRNGLAGDIASAGLIGLGANEKNIVKAMEFAGNHVGNTKVRPVYEKDVIHLEVLLEQDYDHLHETKAMNILNQITNELGFNVNYQKIAHEMLDVLCSAERHVHKYDTRLHHMLHHNHSHHHDNPEAILHEAKDILIDIAGFVSGIQELGVNEVGYVDYVNVGSGTINFSHGEFKVPAPATMRIMDAYGIKWQKSPYLQGEMATPTGACILAGNKAKRIATLDDLNILAYSRARGSKEGFPPVSFYLTQI